MFTIRNRKGTFLGKIQGKNEVDAVRNFVKNHPQYAKMTLYAYVEFEEN